MQSFSTIGLRALAPANKGVKKEIAVFREIPIVDGVGEDSSTTLTSTCCALRLSSGLHRGHSSLSLDRESEEKQSKKEKI
mmetsp:Transcript_51965/g.104247  ORF Transcript_51965/g.104247 Transcript_51965/m.104247 type:complete len:80 (+) Transcript_51965:444-683(+)